MKKPAPGAEEPPQPRRVAAREGLAAAWRGAGTCDLWRRHSDSVNNALLSRWLPRRPVARLLKTDLFDESLTDGLYPILRARARRVFGVDVSCATVAAAVARAGGLHGAGADVRRLPFPAGVFDVVVSISTLDHFESAGEIAVALRELARVLRDGGEMIITLDNLANPSLALRNLLPVAFLQRLGIVPYSIGASCGPRRLRRLLVDAGLEVPEMAALMHCPRPVGVVLAGLFEGGAGPTARRRFGRCMMAFERLSRWPTRFLTGHFIAARAVKTRAPAPGIR